MTDQELDRLLSQAAPMARDLWLSSLPGDGELPQARPSPAFQRRMDRLIRRMGRSPRRVRALAQVRRAAAVALVFLAAGMALCLTLVTTPAASAAQPPQDTPVFEEIVPYSLYIKNQGCDLMISDRTAFIEGWVSGQTGRSTECEVRVELQQKSGSFAWILVDSWTDRQDGTRASVSETVSVTPGETYRVKAVVTVWAGSQSETATIYSETATA